jgi:hypothetical protein
LDFYRYNQCQPAIWNVDYYIRIFEEALRAGATDPWQFESFKADGQEQHYVADYPWPSFHSGFLYKGTVDWQAVRLIRMPEGRPLRDALVRECFGGLPLPPDLLYRTRQGIEALKSFLRPPLHAARRLFGRAS